MPCPPYWAETRKHLEDANQGVSTDKHLCHGKLHPSRRTLRQLGEAERAERTLFRRPIVRREILEWEREDQLRECHDSGYVLEFVEHYSK